MIECGSGYGLNEQLSQCIECQQGYFSIEPSIKPCLSCNDKSLKGVECIGSNKILIAHYWLE